MKLNNATKHEALAVAFLGGWLHFLEVVAFFGFLFLCIVPVSLEKLPFLWIGFPFLFIAE